MRSLYTKKIVIWDTQIWVEGLECSREEKESGVYKGKDRKVVKLVWQEL